MGDEARPTPSDGIRRAAGVRVAACGLVVAAGAAGPWVMLMTDYGRAYDVAQGGSRAIVLAVGAATTAAGTRLASHSARRATSLVAAAAFLVGFGVGAAYWHGARGDLGGRLGHVWFHRVGWGLLAVVVGSAAGAVVAAAAAIRRRAARPAHR